MSETAGLPPWINANTAVWLDYDNDGKFDLFVGGYYPENVNLWQLASTRMMPESFEYAKNGGRKYLFHNLGQRAVRRGQRQSRDRQPPVGAGLRRSRSAGDRLSGFVCRE